MSYASDIIMSYASVGGIAAPVPHIVKFNPQNTEGISPEF
jgi:hypothetical protein